MLLVRVVAFVLVLVLVLGAAVAVQNQALLVPRLAVFDGAGRPEFRTASEACTYLGLKGIQEVPRRGQSCSLLMEGPGQDQAFWNRAEASVRSRTRAPADSDGN
jgi:hypothetical protein